MKCILCEKNHHARGMCYNHYQKWLRQNRDIVEIEKKRCEPRRNLHKHKNEYKRIRYDNDQKFRKSEGKRNYVYSKRVIKYIKNIYFGKVKCPKCNEKGNLQEKLFRNKNTGSEFIRGSVSHYVGKNNYRYCSIYGKDIEKAKNIS